MVGLYSMVGDDVLVADGKIEQVVDVSVDNGCAKKTKEAQVFFSVSF